MKYCKDCVGFDECNATGRTVDFSVDDGVCIDFDERKQKTNAYRIRAMSDEELANEFALVAGWDRKQYRRAKQIGLEKVMLEWLQQPAEGE